MRTTLTLDQDVAVQLKRLQEKEKKSLKQLVNEALRLGLQRMTKPAPVSKQHRTKSVNLGRCSFGSVDDVAEVLAVAEGESFR
jgi:hypothetical protein